MADAPKVIDRTPREEAVRGLQARDPEEYRKYQWKPADALPMPVAPPGWQYRYVRKRIKADEDVSNVSKYMREGWVPVALADHPDMEMSINPSSKNSGNIEIGDLILCKIDARIADSRKKYYENMNARQIEAVDNNLMRENDPRMPLFSDRESKVSFGKGT